MKREGVDERERKRVFNYEVRACMYSLKALFRPHDTPIFYVFNNPKRSTWATIK